MPCLTHRLVDGERCGPAVSLVVRSGRLQVEADCVLVEVVEVTALPPRDVLAHHLGHLVLVQGKHFTGKGEGRRHLVELTLELGLRKVQLVEIVQIVNNRGQPVGDLYILLLAGLNILLFVTLLQNCFLALTDRKLFNPLLKSNLRKLDGRHHDVLAVAVDTDLLRHDLAGRRADGLRSERGEFRSALKPGDTYTS